jgi:hypothetical protein
MYSSPTLRDRRDNVQALSTVDAVSAIHASTAACVLIQGSGAPQAAIRICNADIALLHPRDRAIAVMCIIDKHARSIM